MSNIKQRAAFIREANKNSKNKPKAKKNKRKGKKLTPVSRKGKNKFKY